MALALTVVIPTLLSVGPLAAGLPAPGSGGETRPTFHAASFGPPGEASTLAIPEAPPRDSAVDRPPRTDPSLPSDTGDPHPAVEPRPSWAFPGRAVSAGRPSLDPAASPRDAPEALPPPGGVQPRSPDTWTVNWDGTEADGNVGDGKCDTGAGTSDDPYTDRCTLQAAADEVGATPGTHVITFASGIQSIACCTGLWFRETTNVILDGGDGDPVAVRGTIRYGNGVANFTIDNIWLIGDGSLTFPAGGGISVDSPTGVDPVWNNVTGCAIRNSTFTRLGWGVVISSARTASGCEVAHNRFGVDPAGNLVGTDYAILQWLGDDNRFHHNVVGGMATLSVPDDPFFLDCDLHALHLWGDGNRVEANLLGTTPDGTAAFPNYGGVCLRGDDNRVVGNVLSGNVRRDLYNDVRATGNGVTVWGDRNEIWDNRLGADAAGTAPLGNEGHGVAVFGRENCVGVLFNPETGGCEVTLLTDDEGRRNVVAANGAHGLADYHVWSSDAANVFVYNLVGVGGDGRPLGNAGNGIQLNGTGADVRGNTVQANGGHGVAVGLEGRFNVVRQNGIGRTVSSDPAALGNGGHGVLVRGRLNTVGGPFLGETVARPNNVISGNGGDGVRVEGDDNAVWGNVVGLDLDGEAAVPNAGHGVSLAGNGTLVGGDESQRNFLAGNAGSGLVVEAGSFSEVRGNWVGLAVPPRTLGFRPQAVPNGASGLTVTGGTDALLVDNVLAGNVGPGLLLGPLSVGATVQANLVGVVRDDRGDVHLLANGGPAGAVVDGEGHLVGGDRLGDGNVVAANAGHGLLLRGSGHWVAGNAVGGPDRANAGPLGNGGSGIVVEGGTAHHVGRNAVGGNGGDGIVLRAGASGHRLVANAIGPPFDPWFGPAPPTLPNARHGVFLAEGAHDNVLEANAIAHHPGDGVHGTGAATLRNTLTRNSIFNNTGLGIENDQGANDELPPPTAELLVPNPADPSQPKILTGTTCPGCRVEAFSDEADEGRVYEVATKADPQGRFQVAWVFVGPRVTCTATDPGGNTSEFGCGEETPVVRPPVTKRDANADGLLLLPGGRLEYTVEVTNILGRPLPDGPLREFEDPIPENAAYVPGSLRVDGTPHDDALDDGIGFDAPNGTVVWNGAMAPGATLVLTFQVRVGEDLPVGAEVWNQGAVRFDLTGNGVAEVEWPTDDPDTPAPLDPTRSVVDEDSALSLLRAGLTAVPLVAWVGIGAVVAVGAALGVRRAWKRREPPSS